jgi:hypothetical protein
MKKIYSKPESQVIDIEASRILCTSDPKVYRGVFGQIPGLIQDSENHLS